jgi:CheY-like chemotaxis protein
MNCAIQTESAGGARGMEGRMQNKPGMVLLVEENPDDVVLVHSVLKKSKFEHALFFVSDGEQAIKYLQGEDLYGDRKRFPLPAIMLLDLAMPGKDGFEVLAWVRSHEEFKRLPVTVFTGSVNPNDVARAYELGANSCVAKPFEFSEFRAAVKAITDFWLGCSKLPYRSAGDAL